MSTQTVTGDYYWLIQVYFPPGGSPLLLIRFFISFLRFAPPKEMDE